MAWWRDEPGGAAWLDRLPRLVRELATAWELELGDPFDALISLVVPAVRGDGTEAVLKLHFPEPESEDEADALAFWDGVAAVRLLEHDAERRGLLVERCVPGDQLWLGPDEEEANRIGASVLSRLWSVRPATAATGRWPARPNAGPPSCRPGGRPKGAPTSDGSWTRRSPGSASSHPRSPSSSSLTRTSTAATSSARA